MPKISEVFQNRNYGRKGHLNVGSKIYKANSSRMVWSNQEHDDPVSRNFRHNWLNDSKIVVIVGTYQQTSFSINSIKSNDQLSRKNILEERPKLLILDWIFKGCKPKGQCHSIGHHSLGKSLWDGAQSTEDLFILPFRVFLPDEKYLRRNRKAFTILQMEY